MNQKLKKHILTGATGLIVGLTITAPAAFGQKAPENASTVESGAVAGPQADHALSKEAWENLQIRSQELSPLVETATTKTQEIAVETTPMGYSSVIDPTVYQAAHQTYQETTPEVYAVTDSSTSISETPWTLPPVTPTIQPETQPVDTNLEVYYYDGDVTYYKDTSYPTETGSVIDRRDYATTEEFTQAVSSSIRDALNDYWASRNQ